MALIFNTSCSSNTQTNKQGYFPPKARKQARISCKVLFPNPGHTETLHLVAQNWQLPASTLHSNLHLCCQQPHSFWYRSSTVMLAWQEPKVTSPDERPGLNAFPHCEAIRAWWCPPRPLHTVQAPGSIQRVPWEPILVCRFESRKLAGGWQKTSMSLCL